MGVIFVVRRGEDVQECAFGGGERDVGFGRGVGEAESRPQE